MYSQHQQGRQATGFMPDKDLLYTILADLKRTVREYTTAATEAACPMIRQMFTNLMNNTMQMQGDLYNVMSQMNMYNASSGVLRQEIDKQIQQHSRSQQQTQQFISQKLGQQFQAMPQTAYQQPGHTSVYGNNPYPM